METHCVHGGNARAAVEKFMQNSVKAGFIRQRPIFSKLF